MPARRPSRDLRLVHSRVVRGADSEKMFQTGQTIPESGIYRVIHAGHRLPHEVTLIEDQEFPKCCKCDQQVTFEPIRLAPLLNQLSSPIIVHTLPEIESGGDLAIESSVA